MPAARPFFSVDLQSPPLSLRSSANRLYVYKWKHLNEKIWRKWVLYLVLKDELTLLQIRLFVYFDNILLNPALWFRGWTLRFERDAIMWRVILNPKQPSFRTKLGIYHLHTIPHVLNFLYRAYTTFSFLFPLFFSFIDFQTDIYRQEIILILPKPTSGSNAAHYIPEYYYVTSKFRKSH